MNRCKKPIQRAAVTSLCFVIALATIVLVRRSGAASSKFSAVPIWEYAIPANLQGIIDDVAILPGDSQVVATTPNAVLSVGVANEFVLRFALGPGRSAVIAAEGSRVGIFTHDRDRVVRFEVTDLSGATLTQVWSAEHFHYRLAPKGDSIVGIDSGGASLPFEADHFVYRFFDSSGSSRGEVQSPGPQPKDSDYTPDGTCFLISNAQGLSSYSVADASLRWRISKKVKFFAPAVGTTDEVVASDDRQRNLAELYQAGQLRWGYTLADNVRNLGISPSGGFVLASDAKTLRAFGSNSSEPIWSFTVPNSHLSINSVAVNDLGVVALGAQHDSLGSGTVFILDPTGTEIFSKETAHTLSNAWIPVVQFDAMGGYCLIRTLEVMTMISISSHD